jgi:hypothetical protein
MGINRRNSALSRKEIRPLRGFRKMAKAKSSF